MSFTFSWSRLGFLTMNVPSKYIITHYISWKLHWNQGWEDNVLKWDSKLLIFSCSYQPVDSQSTGKKNNQEQAFHLLQEVSEMCAWTHTIGNSFEKLSHFPKQKPIPLSSGIQTTLKMKNLRIEKTKPEKKQEWNNMTTKNKVKASFY